ncbi:MAG: MFS transporter [Acidimicrobiia bacterium]|jgi:MFS family permease
MPLVVPPSLEEMKAVAPGRRNARPIVIGQAISQFGDYIAYVSLPLFVVELTGRGLDLGLTSAAESLPALLFGVTAGVLLDRARIKRILIVADLVRAAAFGLLAVGAASGAISTWMVFLTAFLVGSMATFFDSGLQAILPHVVGADALVQVNSTLSFAGTLAWSLGPAVGGLLVSQFGGFGVAFGFDAATFLVSAAFLSVVKVRSHAVPLPRERFASALKSGVRFLFANRHLRWATLGAAVINLVFAPLEALLFLLIPDRFSGGITVPGFLDFLFLNQAEVGLFLALQAGLGSVGVALAPRVARRMHLGRMFLAGTALMGIGFGVMASMHSFLAVIPAAVAVSGLGWTNVAVATMRQRITPDAILGRVVAASRTIAWALIPVGAVIGGSLADAVGLLPVYIIGAAMAVTTTVLLSATALWSDPIGSSDVPAL